MFVVQTSFIVLTTHLHMYVIYIDICVNVCRIYNAGIYNDENVEKRAKVFFSTIHVCIYGYCYIKYIYVQQLLKSST